MMFGRASACSRHRAALIDFVDRRECGPDTQLALDHVDRCGECAAEVTEIALAIHGLRRLGAEVARVEPPSDAWERLAGRVARPAPSPWHWRINLGGMVAGAMLVVALVGPLALRDTRITERIEAFPPPVSTAASKAELLVEQNYINTVRAVRPPAVPATPEVGGSVPRVYPDGYRPEQKEVNPEIAIGRPLVAI